MPARPTVILTRPKAASARVAAALGPDVPVLIAPATVIEGTGAPPPLDGFRGVILTSANAVPFLPELAGVPVYCVGARTAEVSGGVVRLVARDAEELVARLSVPGVAAGPLLHAHGRETRGEVAKRLTAAGLETVSCEVYRQTACDLGAAARTLIEGDAPAVLPLWSPRSAGRVAAQIGAPGRSLRVIALSPAVADAWRAATGQGAELCARPDGAEMIARIVAAVSG